MRQSKKTIKPLFFYDEMFQANYWFYLGSSVESTRTHLAKHWDFNPSIIDHDHLGKTIEFVNNTHRCIVIWTKYPITDKRIYPTLAHECLHAVSMTLHRCGVNADHMNDETKAHYVGLLMKKAMRL